MQLIERDEALRQLDQAWQQARDAGCFALVCGEAGIGKTSLVEAFVRRQEGKARRLWGACDALFTPRPLGPLHDIAAQTGGELARLMQADGSRPAIFAAFLEELGRGPTIAVVEDLHWADEATLDLLKYVGRRVRLTHALLIATYRDDELGARHPLRLLLGDLATSPAVRRIAPPPLSAGGVQQLAGGHHRDAAALQRHTGGNPFFVTELLAADSAGVPPTVRDAVLARAARLSLSGRAVLEAAAIAGPRIEPWLLEEITRAEAQAVSESLELGMLQAQGDGLIFRHELARQAILEEIAPHRRAFLHRAVLDALQGSDARAPKAEADLARLAHHAAGAGDREAILAFARPAAHAAAALGNHLAAGELFRLALQHAGDLPLQEQIELNEAYALSMQGDPSRVETLAAYRRARELARQAGDALREGFLLVRISGVLDIIGRREEGSEALQQALAILEPHAPNRGLIDAYRLLATNHLSRGEPDAALAHARRAYDMALNTEQDHIITAVHQVLGLCILPHDHAQGLRHLEESLRFSQATNQYWTVAAAYPNLIMSLVDVYQLARAEELLEEALPFARERDIDAVTYILRAWQAMLRLFQGRWPESAALDEELLAQQPLTPISRNPTLAALGRLRARQGHFDQARALLQEALAQSLKTANHQRLGIYYCANAELAWLAGDRDALLQACHDFLEVAVRNRQPSFAAELAYWLWRAGEQAPLHDWMVSPFVYEMQGQWRAAAEEWARLGCPYERARALSDGDEAAQKEALVIFEQLGAQPMAERTRSRLRQAGVQAIPRGPRSATRENPFGLTNRQLQVLELLTEQLTNAEIAARLHISPKTVDHHVSAVLARLEVASREEAAALVRKQEGQ